MFWEYPPYVSVAERRANAAKEVAKLRKQRSDIRPVTIEGKAIASTFWGKGWCKHMDSMADYENRLPRGRSYVRHGSVCHLEIRQGKVEALVVGSQVKPYEVRIDVAPIKADQWEAIKRGCQGRISSMVDLLQGKLSKEVMGIVCDAKVGMFPTSREIKYACSCPDSAFLCKHIAAVFYGIGNRLDSEPELLFLLRHVDPGELFELGIDTKIDEQPQLAGDLGDIFGIDLITDETAPSAPAKADAAPPAASSHASATGPMTHDVASPKAAKAKPKAQSRQTSQNAPAGKMSPMPPRDEPAPTPSAKADAAPPAAASPASATGPMTHDVAPPKAAKAKPKAQSRQPSQNAPGRKKSPAPRKGKPPAADDTPIQPQPARETPPVTAKAAPPPGEGLPTSPPPAPQPAQARPVTPTLPPIDPEAPTGPAITALREALDYSVYRLASKLGVTTATLARWEKTPGVIGMNAASRRKLARLCGGGNTPSSR